jgi:protein ImuA
MFDMGDSGSLGATRVRLAAVLGRLAAPPVPPLPAFAPLPVMGLARGRVHEVTGPARRVLAAALAGRAQGEGPVLWLRPDWGAERLCPQGLAAFGDPGALITVGAPRAAEVLWAAEEALQSGAVALVIAELATDPDLRQIRRLHRAAAEGVARAAGRPGAGGTRRAPLGVLLMQDAAESCIAGVESRWALHPMPQVRGRLAEEPAWWLERRLARDAPPADWPLRRGERGLAMG